MEKIKSFKAWDISKGSKLPQKGDKVTIDPERYSKSIEDQKKSMMRMGLPDNHPFFKDLDARSEEITKKAKAGEIATVTKARNERSKESDVELKFDDGFECGVALGELNYAE